MITSQNIKFLNNLVIGGDDSRFKLMGDVSLENRELTGKKTVHAYYNRIVKQCKKLSQLIAISWKNNEKSQQIRQIFLNFQNNDFERTSQNYIDMVDLLTGKKGDLLEPWFPDNSFGSIFDPEEIGYFLIQVNWDIFEGSIKEISQPSVEQKGPYFIMTLPYPPKPSAENIDLDHGPEKLEEWLKSPVDMSDPDQTITDPFPPVPYLPTTCT